MIPDKKKNNSNTPDIEKKNKMEFTPEPIECSEKGCKEPPTVAFLCKKEKQFRFACGIHQFAYTITSSVVIEDRIEDYIKRRKRNLYKKLLDKEYFE